MIYTNLKFSARVYAELRRRLCLQIRVGHCLNYTVLAILGIPPRQIAYSSSLSSSSSCVGPTPLSLKSIHGHKRVVVSLNNGEVVAIDGVTGQVIWRSVKGPDWTSANPPNLIAFTSSPDSRQRQEVIVIGDYLMAIFNGDSGVLVGSSALPAPCQILTHNPLLIDFNHDGHDDVVLFCDGSIGEWKK